MAKLSTDELLDAFKEMTLLELSEFVKQFEEVFDVKTAAPSRLPQPPPVAPVRPPPSRSRTSSRSSSRVPATRRSRSSRRSAPSPPSASRRPRTWWTALPSPSSTARSTRSRRRRPRLPSRAPAPASPSSNSFAQNASRGGSTLQLQRFIAKGRSHPGAGCAAPFACPAPIRTGWGSARIPYEG